MSETLASLKAKFDKEWQKQEADSQRARSLEGQIKAGQKRKATETQIRQAREAEGLIRREKK